MEAQEESSNAKETWKMITAAGILGLYGNRQVPEKNPDPRNSPGLLVPALGHLSIAAQVLAGQKPSFLLSLSSSAALLPSLCFFLSLSPSLLSSTSSSPSFLLCLCYSSALFFSLFSPFLSGSPPFSPVSESACAANSSKGANTRPVMSGVTRQQFQNTAVNKVIVSRFAGRRFVFMSWTVHG